MGDPCDVAVREIEAATTRDLRRRVLRDHLPGAPVTVPADDHPATTHLGAYRDGRLSGVVTLFADPLPGRPGVRARRFRFMAVEPAEQGAGIGRALLETTIDRARIAGDELLWANGRDSVLGFYRRLGFAVVGDGFLDPVSQLPHHLITLDL